MRALLVAFVVVVVGLAGCAGDKAPEEPVPVTDFEDLPVEVTETTGAIRGIVVDERITPILGAEVTITGAVTQSTVTDKEGRFVFDGLEPGTYFLAATSSLHTGAQTSVEVVAGVAEPPLTRILLQRLFDQEPFIVQNKHDGFIECNQAGVYYASAPCVTDFTGLVSGNVNGTGPCNRAGCAPVLRTILRENRGFHIAVNPGWQAIIWEMVWEESSATFDTMGVTVSYNVTQRPASHNYATYGSKSPLRMQIDLGVDFEPSNAVEPELIAPEGRPDLYYFVGVRQTVFPVPNVALNQPFQLFSTLFYYGVPPEGWSLVNGDESPF